jgi:hypothetical protein
MFDTTFVRRWPIVAGALLCAAVIVPAYADDGRDDGDRDSYAIGLWATCPITTSRRRRVCRT